MSRAPSPPPASKIRKPPPHAFVLDALERLAPQTRPMFGCLAVYVGDQIVMALRDKETLLDDNGVWLATSREHHESLRRELPSMREVRLLAGGGPTGWQNLPAESDRFEEDALRACELVLRHDPRIGKVPERKRKAAERAAREAQPRRARPGVKAKREGVASGKAAKSQGRAKPIGKRNKAKR
jgi:hypothetical protein